MNDTTQNDEGYAAFKSHLQAIEKLITEKTGEPVSVIPGLVTFETRYEPVFYPVEVRFLNMPIGYTHNQYFTIETRYTQEIYNQAERVADDIAYRYNQIFNGGDAK